jgi:hypothetical protein
MSDRRETLTLSSRSSSNIKNSVRIAKKTQSILVAACLLAIYSENLTKPINTLSTQNPKLLSIEVDDTYS